MRLFSTSTLGWLGGLASSLAILSLIAAGEESGPPKATERVADVRPAAFSTSDGNASDTSGPQALHGDGHGPLKSNLSGERTAARLDRSWSLDRIGFPRGSDDFSGEENPLPSLPFNLAMISQDAPDSQSAYPDAAPYQFPSFPAAPTDNSPAGPPKSGSGSAATSGYFIVVNGGSPGQGFGPPRAVPEPSSWILGCVALGVFIFLRRRAVRL